MSLHRLTSVTMGVPNVEETVSYYAEFGLTHVGGGVFHTADGGEQLRVQHAPYRRLVELGVGVDDRDDVARVATRLAGLGIMLTWTTTSCGLTSRSLASSPESRSRRGSARIPLRPRRTTDPAAPNGGAAPPAWSVSPRSGRRSSATPS